MSLIQLIYKSVAAPGLDEAEVLEILKKSQCRNLGRKISGLLFFRDNCFIQLLAGGEMEVMEMFGRIARDPRHHHVEVIRRGETDRSTMPAWAMAYYSPTVPDAARGDNAFILTEDDARRLCEVLPPAFGEPFLEMLDADCLALA